MKKKITKTNNFYYMTAALILLLLCASLAQVLPNQAGLIEYALQALVILTFAVCLFSLRFGKNWSRFLFTMAGLWLLASLIRNFFHIKEMDLVILTFMFCFFFGTFKAMAKQILFTGNVDFNKVVGSVSLFLLLGLMWTVVYLALLEVMPESFTNVTALPWGENFSKLAYFSFVTLTTLGYGDISPITPFAQVVVYLEAIIGVFYMAIVVSSLVSSSQSNQEQAHSEYSNHDNN